MEEEEKKEEESEKDIKEEKGVTFFWDANESVISLAEGEALNITLEDTYIFKCQ